MSSRPGAEEAVRALCLALPGVTERRSHGAPGFFVGRQFVALWPEGHHEHRFAHLWCAAAPSVQEGLAALRPERFFRPPYVGGRGWVGVRLGCGLSRGRAGGSDRGRVPLHRAGPAPGRARGQGGRLSATAATGVGTTSGAATPSP